MAKENVSLPKPKSPRIGNWNWPMAERGPNVTMAMRQPAAITTSGGNLALDMPCVGAATFPLIPDSLRARHVRAATAHAAARMTLCRTIATPWRWG